MITITLPYLAVNVALTQIIYCVHILNTIIQYFYVPPQNSHNHRQSHLDFPQNKWQGPNIFGE